MVVFNVGRVRAESVLSQLLLAPLIAHFIVQVIRTSLGPARTRIYSSTYSGTVIHRLAGAAKGSVAPKGGSTCVL